MSEQEKSSAEKYRELLGQQAPGTIQTVDVKVPSGFIFKFRKPSKYATLFSTNRLPSFASAAATGKLPKYNDLSQQQQDELSRTAFAIRDRVCELSVDPKIVVGPAAEGTNELSAEHIDNEDLTYLFEWVAAGGDAGLLLAQFRKGQQPNAVARAHGKKLRQPSVNSAVN